ncbi:DUF6484 domain-containing protein [Chitiniphilus eburneus]|uniref:DUF6484 domain-containing protein n=1 Tax=Chitiniphilus eburneus TaxID=2571148 RepID=A0A4U0PK82_9NEIS|nr:DUF6484 domain-containing protein [Chitiniphilus eburneus]TJZ68379.1 hypothetical protein FAZ21_15755 [Chitiniphilus eburneus]
MNAPSRISVATQPDTNAATDAASADLLDAVLEQTATLPATAAGIAVGQLAGFDGGGLPLVHVPALRLSAVAARSMVALTGEQLGCELALGFEGNDPRRPIVLGLMLGAQPVPVAAPVAPAANPAAADRLDLWVDGERVALHAAHEIELRCGDAAIVMTADGRITLRGTYITSHASATQRILGGSVNLN